MICLADNDILLKLACCNLLSPLFEALNIPLSEVYHLSTLPYKLADKKLQRNYGAGAETLRDFLQQIAPMPFNLIPADFEYLNSIEGIDPGEAVLFSSDVSTPDYLIATGDKRSLKALSAASGGEFIRERLQERILCLEVAMLHVIRHVGFEPVRDAVVPVMECDKSMRSAFGSGPLSEQTNVEIALLAYYNELNASTEGMLFPPPPLEG